MSFPTLKFLFIVANDRLKFDRGKFFFRVCKFFTQFFQYSFSCVGLDSPVMSSSLPKLLSSLDTVVEASSDHKPIQAVALDPSGARMVTGGTDGVLKYWDFGGMNCVDPRPFREFIPVEANPINALSFSEVGTLVLCITSDARAKVFDREGSVRPIEETIKGDQYIRTPENTKGHTHMLTCGEFHPKENHRFLTASHDSTVRLWDLNTKRMGMDQNIPNVNCFKCVDARGICGGNKMYVSSAVYSASGAQVVAGCSDGSLHLFNDKTRYGKGLSIVRTSHTEEITGLSFLLNSETQLVSRAMDDTVKFWDVRKFKEPVRSWSGIETTRSFSNIAICDDNRFVVAGTSTGELISIDLEAGTMSAERKKLPTRQLIHTKWHLELNQIFSTAADGNVFICFDPVESRKGALSFIHKRPGANYVSKNIQDSPAAKSIFAYEELIESGKYRENRQGELKEVRERPPVPNFIEPIRSAGVMQALINRKSNGQEDQDVQKFLLTSTEESNDSSGLVSAAYARTQPEAVLDFSAAQGQVDHLLMKRKQYCPQCGLKICTCGFMTLAGETSVEKKGAVAEGPLVTSSKRPRFP